MNVFKRLFKIGQAETNSAIDKLEDPIKMVEQGLRDMREDQDQAMRALAEVKAMHIRRIKDLKQFEETQTDLHDKSILLLKKAQLGEIDATEAEDLVKENLKRKFDLVSERDLKSPSAFQKKTDFSLKNKFLHHGFYY